MSDPIDLPLVPDDRLFDPPLIDCIYLDQKRKGFAVTFVPSDDASSAPKEFIFIAEKAPDYHRVLTFWKRIEELLSPRAGIERAVHAGGGNYVFHFADGSNEALGEAPHSVASVEIADRLKQMADAAQIAFLDRSYAAATLHRA